MLAIAIPFVDKTDITQKCLEKLALHSSGEIELILIDNGSTSRLNKIPQVHLSHYIRNEENLGVLESLRQALAVCRSDILLHMHNDVLIQQPNFHEIILSAFENDEKLGLAGFFGAPGIDPNGARHNPVSRMIGLEWGTHGVFHGRWEENYFIEPSCIFDSLAMVWRKSAIEQVGIPSNIPPHHWFDRILTLRMIENGWRAATLGILFDHFGSATYADRKKFDQFVINWMKKNNISQNEETPDDSLYQYGLNLFEKEYAWRLPLRVDENYNYRWRQ